MEADGAGNGTESGGSMKAEEIIAKLQSSPQSIFEVDIELARQAGHLAELAESLDIAVLNAELSAPIPDGKSNEDTRKKLREQAVAQSEGVKKLRQQIGAEKLRQSEIEARRSMALRDFQGTMAIAELAAAQMYMVAAKTRKESLENGH